MRDLNRKITIEEVFYSIIISILISALAFYLLNVFLQEIFADWKSNQQTLIWIMLIGYLVALIISILVNYKIMGKVSGNRILYAYFMALLMTIILELALAYIFLVYAFPNLEIEFSIALIPRIIITAGMVLFLENVTYIWIITQAIFTVLFNIILYRLNQRQDIKITNPYTFGERTDKYTIRYQQMTSDTGESGFSLMYIILRVLFVTITYGLIHFYFIMDLDYTVKKFIYIFAAYAICNIVAGYIAFLFYRTLGSRKYRELNPFDKERYFRNIVSTFISSLANFFIINSKLFSEINTIGQLFVYLMLSSIVVFLLADSIALHILK